MSINWKNKFDHVATLVLLGVLYWLDSIESDTAVIIISIIWSIAILYGLVIHLKRRFKPKEKSAFRLKLLNDDFAKTTIISIGVIGLIFILISFLVFDDHIVELWHVILLPFIVLYGISYTSNGGVKIKDGHLMISGIEEKIHIQDLSKIVIGFEDLICHTNKGVVLNSDRFSLNTEIVANLILFLHDHISSEQVEISDNFNESIVGS